VHLTELDHHHAVDPLQAGAPDAVPRPDATLDRGDHVPDARGTYQNMAVFKPHYSFGQPGFFLFELTRRPFDTRSVPDAVYDLVVTASDIRGNRRTASRRVTIHNRSGWRG
jgi:hypothetical protein